MRIEKTIFISYRRTNFWTALAVFKELHSNGYDVFFDYKSIPSGDFEQVITENVKSRAHFIVILSPSALERCHEPGDWLRKEIEFAIENKRNIIPLMMEGFEFGSAATVKALTGKLADLKKYNAMGIPVEYFEEAMVKLRSDRFLNKPLESVFHPVSDVTTQITKEQRSAAIEAPPVEKEELTAQEWFERGYKFQDAKSLEEAIRCYTEAIRLEPRFLEAYGNRGNMFTDMGKIDNAIADYDQVLFLKPDDEMTYFNRASAFKAQGNLGGAITDYSKAIKLKSDYAGAYNNRGNTLSDKGDIDGAIKDYDEAIRIKSDYAIAYNNRGIAYSHKGILDKAMSDYNMAIQLKPDYADAYHSRAKAWESEKNYQAAIADYQKYLKLGGGILHNDQNIIEKTIQDLIKKMN